MHHLQVLNQELLINPEHSQPCVSGGQKNCLNEMVHLSAHNKHFG